jgi:hypothetical protein
MLRFLFYQVGIGSDQSEYEESLFLVGLERKLHQIEQTETGRLRRRFHWPCHSTRSQENAQFVVYFLLRSVLCRPGILSGTLLNWGRS